MSRKSIGAVTITCSDCGKEYTYSRSDRKGATRLTCNSCTVKRKRKQLKQMAVEYKGGKCSICGYDRSVEALEFHHIDPSQKTFGIAAKGYTNGWDKMKAELDKCVPLCSNCHKEVEAGIVEINTSMV